MKRHNLKGISFAVHPGNPNTYEPPCLTFYRDPEKATPHAAEIAVLLAGAEAFRILADRCARNYVWTDPSGPTVKIELIEGVEPGSRSAFFAIQNAEEILRAAAETLGVREHMFGASAKLAPRRVEVP